MILSISRFWPTWPVKPRALAAVSFGEESPCPQPPSRDWAMIAPAHKPELNPQHPLAQSASLEHGPVMNCVPGALVLSGVSAEAVGVADASAVVVAAAAFPPGFSASGPWIA